MKARVRMNDEQSAFLGQGCEMASRADMELSWRIPAPSILSEGSVSASAPLAKVEKVKAITGHKSLSLKST